MAVSAFFMGHLCQRSEVLWRDEASSIWIVFQPLKSITTTPDQSGGEAEVRSSGWGH